MTDTSTKAVMKLVETLERRNARRAAKRKANANYASLDERETELFQAVRALVAERDRMIEERQNA